MSKKNDRKSNNFEILTRDLLVADGLSIELNKQNFELQKNKRKFCLPFLRH